MPVKHFKPKTPSLRFKTISTFEEITKDKPEPSLVVSLNKSGGRNNRGRVTSRHRGGGQLPRGAPAEVLPCGIRVRGGSFPGSGGDRSTHHQYPVIPAAA